MTYKRAALGALVALIAVLLSVSCLAQGLELSFQDTDFAEIFRALGETQGLNVLVDPAVQGKGTFQLKGVSFREALHLVAAYSGYDYRLEGNTLLVAAPERIKELEERSVRYVTTEAATPAQLLEALELIMPVSDVYVHPEGGLVVLSGTESVLNRAEELIRALDQAALAHAVPRQDRSLLEILRELSADLGVSLVAHPSLEDTRLVLDVRSENPDDLLEQIKRLVPLKVDLTEHSLVVGPAEAASFSQEERLRVFRLNYIEPSAARTALSLLIDAQKIELDAERKALIVRGTDEELAQVELFLIDFDQPQSQVVLEVWVHEIATGALRDLGIDWKGVPSFEAGDAPVFLELEFNSWDLILALKLLEEKGDAKLLANPQITTLSGRPASIFVGDRVPLVLTDEEGRRTLELLESGIDLKVTPRISDDGYITILVQPEVSTFIWTGDSQYPQIRTREAETTVRVKDGQPFVLGGLLQEEETEALKRIPFLAELPILGKLFEWKETQKKQTEMTIFLIPRIVRDGEGVMEPDFFTAAR